MSSVPSPTIAREPVGFRLVAWTAVVQALLLAFCWVVVGLLNARGTWLLSGPQLAGVGRLFRLPLPLIGIAGAVLVPALLAALLVRETRMPGLLDTDFVVRTLKFPGYAAISGLIASVLAFNVGAFALRRNLAIPPVEAAKISALGLLTGTLLCVLSYFALQRVARPLVDEAMDRGSISPATPTFPIRKKVLACSLAVAAIMSGLFGLEAFTWAQRLVEQKAVSEARARADALAVQARSHPPQTPVGWKALLASRPNRDSSVGYALGAGDIVLGSDPAPMPMPERFLVETKFFGFEDEARESPAFVTRWGDVRAVGRSTVTGYTTVGVILRPDPAALRGVLRSFLVVGLEALAAALLLAWAAARGITRPIAHLQRNLESFAAGSAVPRPIVTDDEVSRLSGSFAALEEAVRQAQERVAELSRRSEREAVLARIAHEVRNPLFGIRSTLEALQLELGGAGAHAEYFSVLRSETQRISALVDRMLEGSAESPEPRAELAGVLADAERLVTARVAGRRFAVVGRGAAAELGLPLPRESAVVLFADLFEALLARDTALDQIAVEASAAPEEIAVALRGRGMGIEVPQVIRARVEGAGGSVRAEADPAGGTVLHLRFPAPSATLNS